MPSIGVQGTESPGASGATGGRRLVTSIHSSSLTPVSSFGPHCLAALVEPAEGLVAVIDECVQRQRLDVWTLDDHLDVGVHPGQELAIGVGEVDLGAERAALHVQRPRDARDGGRQLRVAKRPGEHASPWSRC